MLLNLFMVFLSLSIRTPNEPNKFDYLFETGIERSDTLLISYQWERELGEYYTNQEYMLSWTFYERVKLKGYYISDVKAKYSQIDAQYKMGAFSAGYAYRDGSRLVTSLNLRRDYGFLKVESVTDFHEINTNVRLGLKMPITENLFYTSELRYIQSLDDYFQLKAGLRLKL